MQLQAFDETITKKRLHIFYEGRVVSLASTSELLSKKTKPKREMTYKWKKVFLLRKKYKYEDECWISVISCECHLVYKNKCLLAEMNFN